MTLDIRRNLRTLAAVACLFGAQAASADVLPFSCISNNSGICSQVAPQMSVKVEQGSIVGTALFTFANVGLISSSITDVYFQSTVLTTPLSIVAAGTSAGVSFSVGANPPNLPEGNAPSINFQTTTGLSADSNSPSVQANGVNVGEQLQVMAYLAGTNTFASLMTSFVNGSTRIGIHVQSINGGQSDSMITVVPVPGALPLMATGLLAVGFMARRRRQG